MKVIPTTFWKYLADSGFAYIAPPAELIENLFRTGRFLLLGVGEIVSRDLETKKPPLQLSNEGLF